MTVESKESKSRVKRDGEYSTVERKVEGFRRDSICQQCGVRSTCEAWAAIDLINKSGQMIAALRTCKLFTPVLSFASGEGLFEPGRVNTFRLGMAWASRVIPGQRVKLETNKGVLLGYARISDVFAGTLRQMADAHASANHMLRLKASGDYSADMFKILRYAYGKLYVEWEKMVTVLYLEPVSDPQEEREAIQGRSLQARSA